jgi:hypothetical protein
MGFGVVTAMLAVGAFAAASAGGSSTSSTIRLFEHDTSQANLELGGKGENVGNEFVFAGDLFDHKGGKNLGRAAGTITTVSTGAAGEVLSVVTLTLREGQIELQQLAVSSALFGGKTLSFAITGGTGAYRHATGYGTVQVPVNVPNQTDANFVLHLG